MSLSLNRCLLDAVVQEWVDKHLNTQEPAGIIFW